MPGPPIRTPSDHSPPAGSPRLIAGHHVLHRPLMPRHPPNAQKNKHTTQPRRTRPQSQHKEQRYSRPLYRSQPTRPHAPDQPRTKRDQPRRAGPQPGRTAPEPDSMPPTTHPPPSKKGGGIRRQTPAPAGTPRRHADALLVLAAETTPPHPARPPQPPTHDEQGAARRNTEPRAAEEELPRKEVIQPHLPVRLPCYDFVPITSPTFDRSP